MTKAKDNFERHIAECLDALEIYAYLRPKGYTANFGLRFSWVASVSALDHYVTELIVEKATEHYANGKTLSDSIRVQDVPLSIAINFISMTPAQAVVEFRKMVSNSIRFETFQKANDVAKGLSLIWSEEHKWQRIGDATGRTARQSKFILNSIATRRDRIVHNADFDEATGDLTQCTYEDASKAVEFISTLVTTIDNLVP